MNKAAEPGSAGCRVRVGFPVAAAGRARISGIRPSAVLSLLGPISVTDGRQSPPSRRRDRLTGLPTAAEMSDSPLVRVAAQLTDLAVQGSDNDGP